MCFVSDYVLDGYVIYNTLTEEWIYKRHLKMKPALQDLTCSHFQISENSSRGFIIATGNAGLFVHDIEVHFDFENYPGEKRLVFLLELDQESNGWKKLKPISKFWTMHPAISYVGR